MVNVNCVDCGQKKFAREDVYKKRIESYGSEELLLSSYNCRSCRKEKSKDNLEVVNDESKEKEFYNQ